MTDILRKAALVMALLCILGSAVYTSVALPSRIDQALARSAVPDRLARVEASLIRSHIHGTARTTVLYLNGIDGGDNYYRVRYLLYPLQFVSYWSWQHPNAGGEVWNKPRFATADSLRHILLRQHVDYVVAYRRPAMLRLLGRTSQDFYLFRVDRRALRKGGPLAAALRLVLRHPLPWRGPVRKPATNAELASAPVTIQSDARLWGVSVS